MKPVQLEFERRPHRAARVFLGQGRSALTTGALAVLIAGIGAAAYTAWQAIETAQALTTERQALESLQRRSNKKTQATDSAKLQLTAQQRQSWNQIARQLNTPWRSLLDALEAHTPETVALVSIEPDARRGSFRLQAEAKSLETLLDYAAQLGAAQVFESVALIKHETNEQDANKPLRLSLDIRLRPAPAEVVR